ncbi:Trm112 family protein [Hydrogenivirga sp. 128-5-R1-1]|uniref:Trm112 family protein n=1 Tax=Hydrogenivirga sp. 128-5-R1-1 TaxID=392423 RepID=UPI00015F1D4C|nr:Trm112 family protein [Hydrogenivirga sp. 128-5-R1-1]EDP74307.1 hypothetical protein HG1285_08196 [Hydrogenivirga sp. 128-5-R1-1]
MIDEKLLEIIACPKCKLDLKYDQNKNILICENCRVYYEIIDDIPVLIIEEAKPLNDDK